jgi:integrase
MISACGDPAIFGAQIADRLAAREAQRPHAVGRLRVCQSFHDLRHSYATGALKAGVSPKILSERIGHADVGFFLQTYAHVITNDDREAAQQAASFLIGDGWDPEPDLKLTDIVDSPVSDH